MLAESKLYSFIDQKNGFTLHFLEGQKLISDLAVIHHNRGESFHYFRDAILSIQPMIAYLKPQEGLGVYIDSEDPYFRLKVEMSEMGQMRTLLFPEDFNHFPKKISGRCRIVKTMPNETAPYTSIIELKSITLGEIVNSILKDSYQINGQVFLNEEIDQSIMIMKLPAINVNHINSQIAQTIHQYWSKNNFHQFIKSDFEKIGLTLLSAKEIKFQCHCSRARMILGLQAIIKNGGIEQVFDLDKNEVETKCDYCKINYIISKSELINH